KYQDEQKISELDSELIPTLLSRFYAATGNLQSAFNQLYQEVYGMASIAVLPAGLKNILLATNNGSLYFASKKETAFIFASERPILKKFIEKLSGSPPFSPSAIQHLEANSACVARLGDFDFSVQPISAAEHEFPTVEKRNQPLAAVEITEKVKDKPVYVNTSMERRAYPAPPSIIHELEQKQERINALKRCSKCILPETFPFIEFDDAGICNYCNNHHPIQYGGLEAFSRLLNQYQSSSGGKPDCLMPFSGGRDSSYALHFIKKELGMNPIAFSYDWGMLTDLARRNQSRMCSRLGIEHLLVSADIRKNREHIRKNVSAWLKRPRLGTIPLFMAGDKKFLYIVNQLMKEYNLQLSIVGENLLETTRFKTGFCGIKPTFGNTFTYTLRYRDKLKMLLFYGKEYLMNPAYINSSLLDILDAFRSYYVIRHRNINLFNYIPWEEERIERTLIEQYDWETDPGTSTTWRIGDGTAAFYNYIYYTVAGFTENDTFRSNQIREGLITREKALEKVNSENTPRFDSIQWYCSTVGIDFKTAIPIIHRIPTLY
ncbi:MAG TPA: hypothetical protein VNJ07_05060, partial [Chitinophagales bacterium]|nr:hypothetical protein [Chitinophagales bacterium]